MKVLGYTVFAGANIYSRYPVIKMKLDLGPLAESPTREMGSFNSSLTAKIPSLQEHYCSRGVPGGFVSRLKEGTYLGHVLEHIILELQHLAGLPVIYGKTLDAEEENVVEIIYEYKSREGGIQAAQSALYIVESLLDNREIDVPAEISKIKAAVVAKELGPSTGAIFKAAKEMGIPVTRVGEGSILRLGYGKYQKTVEATITSGTGCIGVDIASDKALTKQLLAEVGIPVPVGGVACTAEEALAIARTIGGPVVIKPFDGNQGKGISLGLVSEAEILKAFALAQNYSSRIVVEKFSNGRQYRLLVVGEKVVAASDRIPAFVRGDGHSTVKQLIAAVNQDLLRGDGHAKPLSKIKIDAVMLMVLARTGKSLESVPRQEEIVYLRDNANISTGGMAIDVTDQVHPENRELAIRAARAVGLDVAGIDLVAADISLPLGINGGAVIEVNAAPGLRMHLYPTSGQPRNVAKDILALLFPPGTPHRIPIVSITGTNGKTTTTRLLGHILSLNNHKVGMTTSDGIYINNRLYLAGDTTGPQSARMVLNDATVDIAVLETARGGIIREGLGYDYSDVSIITNISNDHLGQGGVHTMEDLAHVKSVVAENVQRDGYVVLNADDKHVVKMKDQVCADIIYFSSLADNVVIRRHLGEGGKAVFVKKSYVVMASGNRVRKIIPVKNIPLTINGMANHNIENVLAAVAGCLGLGLDIEIIRNGLKSFTPDFKHNPGRLNLVEIDGVKILIDYGHNVAGYENIIRLIKKMKIKNLCGVIGVPGDRPDKAIMEVGLVAAEGFGQIFIKEDHDLRGRQPGEVAGLLRQGVLMAGFREDKIQVIPDESRAIRVALAQAQPGDMVVIFYEKLANVLSLLQIGQEVANPAAAENKIKQIITG